LTWIVAEAFTLGFVVFKLNALEFPLDAVFKLVVLEFELLLCFVFVFELKLETAVELKLFVFGPIIEFGLLELARLFRLLVLVF
jgi:hypothetical protein